MASTTFSRMTKIGNAAGRSDYISNQDRQEEIVLYENHKERTWKEYSKYEKANQRSASANNEAREIIVALPHDLAANQERLSGLCNEIASKVLGNKRDYEFAVHWNKDRTNLHAHILFSERELMQHQAPKKYKRDIWYDMATNKMAKTGAPGAELRYRKGDVQLNPDGTYKYSEDPFTAKDKKFKEREFLKETNKQICGILNAAGYEYRLFNPETEIAQRHIGKNWNDKAAKTLAEERNGQIKAVSKIEHTKTIRTPQEATEMLQNINKVLSLLMGQKKKMEGLQSKIEGLESEIQECGIFHPFKKRKLEQSQAEETKKLAELQEKIKIKYNIDPSKLEKYLDDAQKEKTRLSNIVNPPKKKPSLQSRLKDAKEKADEYNRSRLKIPKAKSQDLER